MFQQQADVHHSSSQDAETMAIKLQSFCAGVFDEHCIQNFLSERGLLIFLIRAPSDAPQRYWCRLQQRLLFHQTQIIFAISMLKTHMAYQTSSGLYRPAHIFPVH
jgi:hypothetical protein